MTELADDVKRFIVNGLACFDTPQEVSDAVNLEFGLSVPRQQVAKYDPTKANGAKLSAKWRTLFETAREGWRKGTAEVPIANRVSRLRALDRLATKAERMKNYALTLQVLERAAREVGDMYVSRRGAGGTGGAGEEPLTTQVVRGVLRPDETVPVKPIL